MKNLTEYSNLGRSKHNSSNIENSYLYIHGISDKYIYDEDGQILLDSDNNAVIKRVLNFDTVITKPLEGRSDCIFISWDRKNIFDYIGLAVICDEVVYIKSSDFRDTTGDEIRLVVKRAVNETKKGFVYPQNSIIRSVVNITYMTIEANYESRSDVSSSNLFAPVVDSAVITITDDMYKWAQYNEDKIYNLKKRLPVYVFDGIENEVVCDYVGFIDSFNINSVNTSIQLICKDKMSIVWNDDIKYHKVYNKITIKKFLSEFLNIPINMVIYPIKKNSAPSKNEQDGLYYWDSGNNSLYSDSDFFEIDVLATKDFAKYSDLFSAMCKELMCRIKFDTYERLVIQSDVFISNNETIYLKNDEISTVIDEADDIIEIQQDNSNLRIINKIEGSFIERSTYYDKNDFLLRHKIYDKFYTSEKTSPDDRILQEDRNVFNPSSLDNRNSETPKIEISGEKYSLQVVVILNDSNYNGQTTWYRWSVIPHTRNDKNFGVIKSITWDWVFKGVIEKLDNEDDYCFTERVKYSKNRTIKNASFMRLDSNDVPEFTILKTKDSPDSDFKLEIPIGEDIKNIAIGNYVMITDGTMDFIGKISDKKYGVVETMIASDHRFQTDESSTKKHEFSFYNPNLHQVDKLVLADGTLIPNSWYTFHKDRNTVTGTIEFDTPYKTYQNNYEKIYMQPYSNKVENSIYTEYNFTTPFAGKYTGYITPQKQSKINGTWENFGNEWYYATVSDAGTTGSVVGNIYIDGNYEYRTIISNVVFSHYANYKNYYKVYYIQQRSLLERQITYSGTLNLNTYKYTVYINGQKVTNKEDEDLIDESTITVMMGFDPDYNLNYWGRHEYLEEQGYVNSIRDYQMFYVRNEYPYVWKLSNQEGKHMSVKYPLLPGEVLELTGDFGGIETETTTFPGIVDDVEDIYNIHLGKLNAFNNENDIYDALYSREYHQPVPVYIRANTIDSTDDKLKYITFDNRWLCVDIKSGEERYKKSEVFLGTSDIYEASGSKKDLNINVCNMRFGDNYRIISNTKTYIKNNDNSILIEKGTRLKALDWTNEDYANNSFLNQYKVLNPLDESDKEFYYVNKADCDLDFEKIEISKIYGKRAIIVDNTKYNFNVGDVIMMDEINKSNINTATIYLRYGDARWQVTTIDRKYNDDKYDLLYLDYEFPTGENNAYPVINQFKYYDINVLQELMIKGNPYVEEVHNIKYENTTSVEIYGEYLYEGLTGKFLSVENINKALSYIIDGFAAINKDTTKMVMPLTSIKNHELELFDLVRISESYYTGMTEQIGIITGIKRSFNMSSSSCTYTVFTLGRYSQSNNLSIEGSQNYNPIQIPEYSETEESDLNNGVNLTNKSISQQDTKLGNVMLLQISSDNLSAKIRNQIESDDNIIEIYDISSYYDGTKDLYNKKYYTDILLDREQELFIRIGGEFIYGVVVENVKETQSSSEEDPGERTYVSNIVSEAKIQVKQRGVFDTSISTIQKDSSVQMYQIVGMVNENGNYTTAILVGDKIHREFFEFTIDDGLDIQSGRGKILLNTNDDWYIQAKDVLYNLYDSLEVNSLTENEVVDYLGRGIIQIGHSSEKYVEEWKKGFDYYENDYAQFGNIIYEAKYTHTSSNSFTTDFERGYWEKKYNSNEYGQFLRYSPVGGLSLRGNVDIMSGKFKINDYLESNNFMHLTENYGYLGLGTNGNTEISYLKLNGVLNSYFQIGDSENSNIIFYTTDAESKLKITLNDFDLKAKNEVGQIYSSILFDEKESNFTMDTLGTSNTTLFQIGKYTPLDDYGNFIKYATDGINTLFEIMSNNAKIGNSNHYIQFSSTEDLTVTSLWTFNNDLDRDSYFGTYDNISDSIQNGTPVGNSEFTDIISLSKNNIRTYIITNKQYQYFSYIENRWVNYEDPNIGMLYLNNGMQQIGNKVKDTVNPYGYSGFYFGQNNANGIGNIRSGQYIKYDGTVFSIGKNISCAYGNTLISLDELVNGAIENNITGSTTFYDDKILIYTNSNKYIRMSYGNNEIIVKPDVNSDTIHNTDLNAYVENVTSLTGIQTMRQLRFVSTVDSEDSFEAVITYISENNSSFKINKVFSTNDSYYIEYLDTNNLVASIGDLNKTVDIEEPIRIGTGIFQDSNGNSATGLYLRDGLNYFKFDTINGLSMSSTNGIIDIKNGSSNSISNEIYFDTYRNSFIRMNDGKLQLGVMNNIPIDTLSKYNDQHGFFVGSKTSDSYLAFSDNNGLTIRGNLIFDNGDNVYDTVLNNKNDINNRVTNEINEVQQMTIYSEEMPVNVVWKNNSSYKIYNISSNTWKDIPVATNSLSKNALYSSTDGKYYIYNNYTNDWMRVYIISSSSEPSNIAKHDTLWIKTSDNSMYRYNMFYSFLYEQEYSYNLNTNNIFTSPYLENVGMSDYYIEIDAVMINNSFTLKINDNLIQTIYSSGKIKGYVKYGILEIGNNRINLSYDNSFIGKIEFKKIKIYSTGNKKWDATITPNEITTGETINSKNSVFTIRDYPNYSDKILCTGQIYTLANNQNKIYGKNTKFTQDYNRGDLIFFNNGDYYVIEKIDSDTLITTQDTIEEIFPANKYYKIKENWTDVADSENVFSDYYDSSIQKIGTVVRFGEMEKIAGIQYTTRRVVTRITGGKVYAKTQYTSRLYPFKFTIENIRNTYSDPKTIIRPNDIVYIINYFDANESATFTYFPRDRNLHKPLSVMDTALNNITSDDFVLSSSSNDKTIFIQTNKSKLYFNSDPYIYDEIQIAHNGTYGKFSIGSLSSSNYLIYDSEKGLDISTQNSINIAGSGTLNITGGQVNLTSKSSLVLDSGATMSINGGTVNINSNSSFTVRSKNTLFSQESNISIESQNFTLNSKNVTIFGEDGNFLFNNRKNEILFSNSGDSRIIINKDINTVNSRVLFQLGDELVYYKDTGLTLNNVNISLKSDKNLMLITPNSIMSKSIDSGYTRNVVEDVKSYSENIKYRISNFINNHSVVNKESKGSNVIKVYTSSPITYSINDVFYLENIDCLELASYTKLDFELIEVSENKYIIATKDRKKGIEIFIRINDNLAN